MVLVQNMLFFTMVNTRSAAGSATGIHRAADESSPRTQQRRKMAITKNVRR